jgi:dihydrofolate reductase
VREASLRRVRYRVAARLGGLISVPNGEVDWIVREPDMDFAAVRQQFDTLLVGRRTFEVVPAAFRIPGMRTFVLSQTLRQEDQPEVSVAAAKSNEKVAALRAKPGKDNRLFGGGSLVSSLLGTGLVDTVEVAVMPVLLGGGMPLLPLPTERTRLSLTGHKVYKTGTVSLENAVDSFAH